METTTPSKYTKYKKDDEFLKGIAGLVDSISYDFTKTDVKDKTKKDENSDGEVRNHCHSN